MPKSTVGHYARQHSSNVPFWPVHILYTQCHDRREVNGIHPKQSWERKRENDKLENTDTAEKLLRIHKELKAKTQKVSSEAVKKENKTVVLSNRGQTVKQ